MLEYAAFGFVTLKWWTWPILWSVVLIAVYAAQRLSAWRDRADEKRNRSLTPEPCVAYMGTDADDYDHWCWRRDGHDGEHRNLWGVPQSDFEAEPDELDRVVDAVKERHPEVPWDELQTPPGLKGLCSWGEDGGGNESACWKIEGHDGPHMVQDHFTGDNIER